MQSWWVKEHEKILPTPNFWTVVHFLTIFNHIGNLYSVFESIQYNRLQMTSYTILNLISSVTISITLLK